MNMDKPASRNPVCPQHGLLGVRARYYGVFLTFQCPFSCSFCIRRFHSAALNRYEEISASRWIDFLTTLDTRGLPLVFQGGEPGLHPGFADIIQFIMPQHRIQIITNLAFDVRRFAKIVEPSLLNRDSDITPLLACYHPEEFSAQEFIERAAYLQAAGFRMTISGFTDPARARLVDEMGGLCRNRGLDFRPMAFLDWYQDRFYGGSWAAEAGLEETDHSSLPALLFAPDGSIFCSHHHLYEHLKPVGHISGATFARPAEPAAYDFCGARVCAGA